MPASIGCEGAFGRGAGPATPVGRLSDGRFAAVATLAFAVTAPTTGRTSYARRLMFSKCFGEMLSEVMLPPQPPHPSVIAGSSPVVMPTDPWVVGVLTTMRKAGFLSPNS